MARIRFWTAVHELGHAFNLAHVWQKSLGIGSGGPWVPLVDQPEARSFMNYPYRVSGGVSAFFADFAYRFTDDELLFLRHAPERFVQQGNAARFDNHGFEQANISPEPQLALELRVHRDDWHGVPTFGFLEPVYVELKLSNVGPSPVVVDEHILLDRSAMVVVVKREGRDATMRMPYASFCNHASPRSLAPGEALYESMLASVTRGGFMIDEPGRYVVQMALELPSGEHLVSNRLQLRVAPPKRMEHERLAGDYLTDDVGRIYSFGGSRVLDVANDTLEEVVARMPDEPVARHAHLMLGRPAARPHKLLDMPSGAPRPEPVHQLGGGISVKKAEPKVAEEHLHAALDDAPVAAETLGHIRFNRAVDRFATVLEDQGEHAVAAAVVGQAQRAPAREGSSIRWSTTWPSESGVSRPRAEARPFVGIEGDEAHGACGARTASARARRRGAEQRRTPGRPAGDRPGAATRLVLSDPRMVSVNCRSSRPGIPAAYGFRGRHPRGRGDRAVPTVRQPEPATEETPHASAPEPARRAVHRSGSRRPGHADRKRQGHAR